MTFARLLALVGPVIGIITSLWACRSEDSRLEQASSLPVAIAPTRGHGELVAEEDALVSAGALPLRGRFEHTGASFVRSYDGAKLTLRATSFGRRGATRLLDHNSAPHRGTTRTRVDYRRGELTEWFDTTPAGVEQGFTIAAKPTGSSELRVEVSIGDDMVVVPAKTPNVLIIERRSDRARCFRYGSLSAKDAEGRTLPATMSALDEHTIAIDVDDHDARYPITVDPLVWALQTKLTRLQAKAQDQLGRGIVIANDTLFIGMNSYDNFKGAVARFVRQGPQWVEANELLRNPASVGPDAGFAFTPNFGLQAAGGSDRVFVGSSLAVLTFVRQPTTWAYEQRVIPPVYPGFAQDALLAADGERLVIAVGDPAGTIDADAGSAPFPDGGTQPSVIFVYSFNGGSWNEETRFELPSEDGRYGLFDVALSGDSLAVATAFEILLYRRVGTTWTLEATFGPPSIPWIGARIAFDGTTLVVARGPNPLAFFERSAGSWALAQELDVPAIGRAGEEVLVQGDTAFMSIRDGATGNGFLRYGRTAGVWTFAEELLPDGVGLLTDLGGTWSAATDGRVAVFGDFFDGVTRGAAYVYELRSSLGDACTEDVGCHSGFCVDGVCCDTRCGGGMANDCVACNRPDRRGTCSAAQEGIECRLALNECDLVERCDGVKTTCPADVLKPNGSACSTGACVAGACTSLPSDPALPASATPSPAPPTVASCAHSPASEKAPSSLAGVLALAALASWRRRGSVHRGWLSLTLACSALLRPSSGEDIVRIGNSNAQVLVGEEGATFVAAQSDVGWQLELESLSRAEVTVPIPRATPRREPQQAILERGNVTEIYAATTDAIEHTFIVHRKMNGVGALVARFAIREARIGESSSQDARIASATDGFRLGAVHGVDACGRTLSTRVAARENAIEITIDDRDAIYPVVIDPLVWRERQRFSPAPSTPPRALFGNGAAVRGDLALVPQTLPVGEVHVFERERSGKPWQRSGTLPLLATDGPFGQVQIAGDTLAIAAPVADGVGAVFLLTRTTTGFEPLAKVAPDAALGTFGHAIALDGDTLVVGNPFDGERGPFGDAQGKIHVFERSGAAWVLAAELTEPEALYLGFSVAVSGTTIVAGATLGSLGALGASLAPAGSAAYFFEKRAGMWQRVQIARDLTPRGTNFGETVDVDGDTAIISAPFPGTPPTAPLPGGSVYVFKRVTSEWVLSQELRPLDTATYDVFGTSRLRGNRILAAALGGNDGKGAMYMFERSASDAPFLQTHRFVDPLGERGDIFASGALDGDTALLVALGRNSGRGEILFHYLGLQGEACTDGDKCASGLCVDGVCCDSACGNGDATDCLACSVANGAAVDGTCGPVVAGRTCRAARDECDVTEACDGVSASCGADVSAENGTACGGGTRSCIAGACADRNTTLAVEGNGVAPARVEDGGGCTVTRTRDETKREWMLAFGVVAIAMARRSRSKERNAAS